MSSQSVKTQRQDANQPSLIKSKSTSRLMPREIILRNHSYLDPGSLFCISFVNKHFQELSNNKREDQIIRDLGVVGVQERLKKYWRNAFFKKIAGVNVNKWRTKLQCIDPYSGLPRHIEEVIMSLCITWEITVTDGRGRRSTFEQFHAFFSSMAVFVFWGVVNWPPFNQLTSLELHAVLRVPLDCPAPYRCATIVNSVLLIQDQWGIAFVVVNLHNHRLVERSLRNSRSPITHLVGDVSLPWRTHHTGPVILTFLFTALNTNIRKFSWSNCCLQDCCMINLTVWDEAKQPFWFRMRAVSYDFDGGSFSILYQDSEGRVEMRLKQMEYKEQYFVVNLVIYIAVAKVNKHFRRDY
uniref:F-box protein 15 n=1 Tax=Cyprinus carpio carpio TaxID=630221 RepID=A0A8C1H9W3_CYPCA